ncbi:MAG: deoxyribodipyrimidine photo-lyase [Spirochaetes bacterium]|nr:deoxyribodipyrimidine photo-lyase [Spirochaetota bacterium]
MKGKGPIVYWMSRDQRIEDNRALNFALRFAIAEQRPFVVCFCLVLRFLDAPLRAYDFMLGGLKEVAAGLTERRIPFLLLLGDPPTDIPLVLKQIEAGACVTDFDPLRIKREWKAQIADKTSIPLYEVDAHNIVPCWESSQKQEFSARTIRPKILNRLQTYLTEDPWVGEEDWKEMRKLNRNCGIPLGGALIQGSHTVSGQSRDSISIDWGALQRYLQVDVSVPPVTWLTPGTTAARRKLECFIQEKLPGYDQNRNDPNKDSLSDLSPYLHFGQISAREVALAVERSEATKENKEAFLEQLIVRKELSDNYCYYNPCYDSFDGFPQWAQMSLRKHEKDPRPYLYTYEQLDRSQTHDPLWNAAQNQLVLRGKLHGYLRMYWAKKILEWTPSARIAMEYAVRLNDRYNLDGRDPNGYVGCAWAIGGTHDRPWFDRPIFGQVRYMSYSGAFRKFNVEAFLERWGTQQR